MKQILSFTFLLSCLLIGMASSQQLNFTNPILDRNSADPCILHLRDSYYLTLSENSETELTIFKSPVLTSFRNEEKKVAYRTPPGGSDLWASEMHIADGELYIYFTMRIGDHRMYVIKADNSSNPMGNWSDAIRLMPERELGAIDGTVMRHNNRLYFLYVYGGPMTNGLAIWIAPMINATSVADPKILLRDPKEEWECQSGCVNEGPLLIYNKNVSYMIFSGSSTWDIGYCLTHMSIEAGRAPMNVSNWESAPGPVFSRNEEEDVYGPGHAAFTTSPDGTETWMVYHGMSNTTHVGSRIARIEKIEWNSDGSPLFPRPHGFNHPQSVPSGQTSV